MVILVAFILCYFSFLKSLLQDFWQIARYLLDTSLFYRDFWVSSRYLLIDSPIHWAKFFEVYVSSKASRYLSIYRPFVLDRSSIPSWSIKLCFLYILLRSDLVLNLFKYLDLSLFSLDLNTFFSPNSLLPSSFQPNPSLLYLASVLDLFFFPFFMNFMHSCDQDFSFGKILGFLWFCQNLWLCLLKW